MNILDLESAIFQCFEELSSVFLNTYFLKRCSNHLYWALCSLSRNDENFTRTSCSSSGRSPPLIAHYWSSGLTNRSLLPNAKGGSAYACVCMYYTYNAPLNVWMGNVARARRAKNMARCRFVCSSFSRCMYVHTRTYVCTLQERSL